MTDDGSLTTTQLVQSLTQKGWKVVVLSFPASVIAQQAALPEGIRRVVLENLTQEHLQHQLAAIATQEGSISAFIHLHPVFQDVQTNGSSSLEAEAAIVKQVFFMAKYLKSSLNDTTQPERRCFLTVARLDGQFGLGGQKNFSAIAGGLFGLTKALRWEWQSVFCRAIDVSPDLDASTSVEHILAELYDPNYLLTEVGYSAQGRTTLDLVESSNPR